MEKVVKKKINNRTLHVRHRHGKCNSVGVSQTHVQPTSNVPLLLQATDKSDTASTIDHNHGNCHVQHLPDTVPIPDITEEVVIYIPIDVEDKNKQTDNYTTDNTGIIEPFNENPQELHFHSNIFLVHKLMTQVQTMIWTKKVMS